MKRFMMISAVLVAVMAAGASSAKADHRHGGSTFGISIGYGNGLNNFNVGYGRGGFGNPYGGYNRFNSVPVYQPVRVYSAPVYSAPVYSAPVYSAPVYSAPVYSAPVYSVPVYSAPVYGGGYGGYRHHRHCH